MKKSLFLAAVATLLVAVSGYYLYQAVLGDVLAGAITADTIPDYIPKRMQGRIQALRKPVTKGTEALLHEMHQSEIPMRKIISVIDNTSEEEAYRLLDELTNNPPETTDEVFTIIHKHLEPDFDVDVFRKPFNDHVSMKDVRRAIRLANQNRKSHDVDFNTAKAIIKKILLDGDREFQAKQRD